MKTHPALLLAVVLCASGCQSTQTASAPEPTNVTVVFHDQEKFTDVRDSNGDDTSQYYLDTLSKHLKETATKRLAAGQTLTVTFSDIDLAGDIPPGSISSVRFIKAIYIPRMKLTFQLKDASGAIVKEGSRQLADLDFQMKFSPSIDRNEPLYYDKQMLSDWIRKEFPPVG
jgi:hypothetical protein